MGVAATLHTEMGTGAVLPYQDIPGANGQRQPNNILVTLSPRRQPRRTAEGLEIIVPASTKSGGGAACSSAWRKSPISQSMGTAPVILALLPSVLGAPTPCC